MKLPTFLVVRRVGSTFQYQINSLSEKLWKPFPVEHRNILKYGKPIPFTLFLTRASYVPSLVLKLTTSDVVIAGNNVCNVNDDILHDIFIGKEEITSDSELGNIFHTFTLEANYIRIFNIDEVIKVPTY